jgi:hypothetical protein
MLSPSLPPSMIVSPGSNRSASPPIAWSVISPAGSITHAARGFSSLAAKSARVLAPQCHQHQAL